FLQPWYWADYFLYFALNFVFVCLLSSHALEVRREQHQKARLELEMLRRHLQPHFLMNTLTALSEWIEEDPKTAVKMIESLSDSEESGNGGGTKYIEARLREAWGERWTFQQGRAGALWRTEIVVPS